VSTESTPETPAGFVRAWLDAYTGDDPATASRFYQVPLLAVLPDAVRVFETRSDVEDHLVAAAAEMRRVEEFRADDGVGEIESLHVRPLTGDVLSIAGAWVRRAPDGTVTERVAFADLLGRTDHGLKILVAVAADPRDVVLYHPADGRQTPLDGDGQADPDER
jgi:hypothetical protein